MWRVLTGVGIDRALGTTADAGSAGEEQPWWAVLVKTVIEGISLRFPLRQLKRLVLSRLG